MRFIEHDGGVIKEEFIMNNHEDILAKKPELRKEYEEFMKQEEGKEKNE